MLKTPMIHLSAISEKTKATTKNEGHFDMLQKKLHYKTIALYC